MLFKLREREREEISISISFGFFVCLGDILTNNNNNNNDHLFRWKSSSRSIWNSLFYPILYYTKKMYFNDFSFNLYMI